MVPDAAAAATVAASRSVMPRASRAVRPEVVEAAKALMAAGVPLELATAQAELQLAHASADVRRRSDKKRKKEKKSKKEKWRRREKSRRREKRRGSDSESGSDS